MARIPADLELLNQTTLKELENAVKDFPPGSDLWPFIRKLNAEHELQHVVPGDGDISILWPLGADVASLLCDNSPNSRNVGEAQISRSKLSRALKNGDILYQYFSRAVVRVAPGIVVKINKSKDVTEMANLDHIHSASRAIPVPAPLGMLSIAHFCYHFTTHLPGVPLDRIWGDLTSRQKKEVRGHLNHLFTELRNLPLPSKEGYFGTGSPPICKDHRRWTRISTPPIVNEKQFNDFLLSQPHSSRCFTEYLSTSLPSDHHIVMAHGDLHPRNLLVEQEHPIRIIGIVDWEFGGGYPEYWEYIQALKSSFTTKDDDCLLFLPEEGVGKHFDAFARDVIVGRMVS